jgi:biopolymer transport protein ExbB/TolQ
MQSKIEETTTELEVFDAQKKQPRSCQLYQEYSQCDIDETVRRRRTGYEKADKETKRKLEREVEKEVEDFHLWLEQNKNLQRTTALYCSISLKSLLLGLPTGMQIAQLFDIILKGQF